MKINNEGTYCPHCWSEVDKDDTTCCTCGEAIEHDEDEERRDRHCVRLLFLVAVIVWVCLAYKFGWII